MSAEITYGIAMLREDAKFFAESGKDDMAARCRAAADKIEALAKKADANHGDTEARSR